MILVADGLHKDGLDLMRAMPGVTVVSKPALDPDTLPGAIGDAQVLIVRSTKVQRPTIDAAKKLALIVRAGAGVNNIDLEAAGEQAIFVSNCPGMNAAAVAELAMGLILSIDRQIPENLLALREGKWLKKRFSSADGIKDKTLGVVGVGRIGVEVIRRALPFDMKVVAWSRSLTEERAAQLGVTRVETPMDIARVADIITIHLALNENTRGIISRDFIEGMKPGAMLINTARAEHVDQDALREAVQAGRIRAGIDMHPEEPSFAEGEVHVALASTGGFVGTHHIGASTGQAQRATGMAAATVVKTFLETGEAPNCVNLRPFRSESPACLIIRHADRVGVLAGVFEVLKKYGHNIQEIENRIFEGKKAACAKVSLERSAEPALLQELASCDGVFHVAASNG